MCYLFQDSKDKKRNLSNGDMIFSCDLHDNPENVQPLADPDRTSNQNSAEDDDVSLFSPNSTLNHPTLTNRILGNSIGGTNQVRNHQSRRSTITFLIKSHNDSSDESDTNDNSDQQPVIPSQLIEIDENGTHSSTRRSNISLDRSLSLDTTKWSTIRKGRRRASSVWSTNSRALRVSVSKALAQRSPTSPFSRSAQTDFSYEGPANSAILSLNGTGNHVIQSTNQRAENGGMSTVSSSRRQSSSETKKELRLARISLCIVWLFLFCHVWKLVPTFYSTFLEDGADVDIDEDKALGISVVWPDWLQIVENISHTLITLNSSLNFLIYIVL